MTLDALHRRIPEDAKPALRALANGLDPIVLGLRRLRGSPAVPPRRLRASVGQPSPSRYLSEGAVVAVEVRDLLARHGHAVEGFGSICDLASGPGKVLTNLELPPETRVAAIDVNRAAIEWLRGAAPRIDARAVSPTPPTSFPDRSFDLIISISLFTHLSEASQFAWLAEVNRLLADGGVALLTVHGHTAFEGFRAASRPGITPAQLAALRRRADLEDEGFAFEPEEHPDRRSPGVEASYGLAFHSGGYVRERWRELVDVERIVPAAINFRQDAVFLRRSTARR